MKKIASLLTACTLATAFAAQAADVGVSVQVVQPGVYGRIDIGRYPQPAVIVPQPVVIAPGPVLVQQPAYMWVPPGHRKKWDRHCHKYNACGVPVYFVRHDWYDSHVRAPHRGGHDGGRDGDRGHPGRGHGHGHRH